MITTVITPYIPNPISIPLEPPKQVKRETMQNRQEEMKNADSFRMNIQAFINFAESHQFKMYPISSICEKFKFQRRRFYDLINVLEAVGCCKKPSVDCINWVGISNIKKTFTELKEAAEKNVNLFPDSKCISISSLTVSFIMMFYANKTDTLDVKKMGTFLSRNNGRYKTTVCKLYQIAYILESIGVIHKSYVIPGEISLVKEYFDLETTKPQTMDPCEFFSIDTLLNRPRNFEIHSSN